MKRRIGRLWLMPNTLDLGTDGHALARLDGLLPTQVIEIAARVEHWVVEHAKTTRTFLRRVHGVLPLSRPLQALHIVELPRPVKGAAAAWPDAALHAALLAPAQAGHDIALQSEAGVPALADPGAPLVRAAHEAGVPVCPLVGPSSLLMAASATGMNGQNFAFVGYLPVDAPARAQRIRQLEQRARSEGQTQLFIETPYRNAALLATLLETLAPSTGLCVAAALTLPVQSVRAGRVAQWRLQPPDLPLDAPCVFAVGNWDAPGSISTVAAPPAAPASPPRRSRRRSAERAARRRSP